MESSLIDAILSCYANGLNALSRLLGVSVEIIKLGVGVAIVFLALVLYHLFCGKCCCCSCAHTCTDDSSTAPSASESDASGQSSGAISPAKFNQQNIALAEAYLDMQEADKARECLAKLHAAALSDEELGKVQQLQKRLEN